MKASDLFIKCLEKEGVEYIFGLPGEENADIMISLMESKIDFVLCRHEQVAAFMADVYGRLTGRAGVCLGTLGPGATNLITGVADGNMDRAPMVVLTGQADTKRLHKESHQNMDVVRMFAPVTKWNFAVHHPSNVPEMIRKAFKVAQAEKPGACHIELPEDLAKEEVAEEHQPLEPRRVRRPGADHKAVAQAMELIRAAKHPVLLAGNGSLRKRATKQLREFARRSGIGVVSTFMGKGVIPRHDPHCLFTMGLQARDLITCEMEKADLVIAVGYDLVEYHPRYWNIGRDKKVVHIDFEAAEIDRHYDPDVEIVADIADAIWALNEQLPTEPLFDIGRFAGFRKAMVEDLEAHADDDTEGLIRPQKALHDLRQVMGPEDIVLSDVGAHKMWVGRYYQCDEPNTCLISNGFCSMGFALPGAMAAKMVHPERKVAAVAGDAGFLMNIHDLETAVRRKLAFVCLVWEDGEYGLIKWKQTNSFGRHSDLRFGNPDWIKLAESFGCWGRRVDRARDLRPTLEEAFRQDVPAIVVMPVDYRENRKLTERLGAITCKL
ncbi:MAG: acetolactate synthase large subunit [Planctomycetes bacterium]|nr:acetolactate synthase large subunit [Planctomycetota bacterium]